MKCVKCNNCPAPIRYTGPNIPKLGVKSGDLLEVVLQNMTDFVTGNFSDTVSVLTDNQDGTFTHKGGDGTSDSTTIVTGKHTTSLTAPILPNYGDTWYDQTLDVLKIFSNNGNTDVWVPTKHSNSDRFKEETVYHNTTGVLAVTPNLHNKKEIHYKNIGDLSINGSDHLGDDDYTYLVVNTTDVDRSIVFSNIAAAYVRSGGAIENLTSTGFIIPKNTSALITITTNGGLVYVNGHFYATGDILNRFGITTTLVADTPNIVNIPNMDNIDTISVYSDSNEDITSGVSKIVGIGSVTITSNVTLTDVQVKVLYEGT